jgi:hypothetical protein
MFLLTGLNVGGGCGRVARWRTVEGIQIVDQDMSQDADIVFFSEHDSCSHRGAVLRTKTVRETTRHELRCSLTFLMRSPSRCFLTMR